MSDTYNHDRNSRRPWNHFGWFGKQQLNREFRRKSRAMLHRSKLPDELLDLAPGPLPRRSDKIWSLI